MQTRSRFAGDPTSANPPAAVNYLFAAERGFLIFRETVHPRGRAVITVSSVYLP